MTDKKPMQADGDGEEVARDGVANPPGEESQGGAYPNPHRGKAEGGFDGGQSHKGYSGPANPNATTDEDD